jgi:hypothetical protein
VISHPCARRKAQGWGTEHLSQSFCVPSIPCVKSEGRFSEQQLRKYISLGTECIEDEATENNNDDYYNRACKDRKA